MPLVTGARLTCTRTTTTATSPTAFPISGAAPVLSVGHHRPSSSFFSSFEPGETWPALGRGLERAGAKAQGVVVRAIEPRLAGLVLALAMAAERAILHPVVVQARALAAPLMAGER